MICQRFKQYILCSGRNSEASVNLQQRFTQFSVENGILPDNIVILPKNGKSLIKTIQGKFIYGYIVTVCVNGSGLCSLAFSVLLQVSVPRFEESSATPHPSSPRLSFQCDICSLTKLHLRQWHSSILLLSLLCTKEQSWS